MYVKRWSTYVNVFFSEFYLRTCKMRESERESPTGEILHGLYGSWRLWKPWGLRQLDGSEEQQSCTKSASRTCEAISQDCRTKLCTQLPGTTMCEFAWLCDSAWCFSLWGRFSCPHSTLGHMICLECKVTNLYKSHKSMSVKPLSALSCWRLAYLVALNLHSTCCGCVDGFYFVCFKYALVQQSIADPRATFLEGETVKQGETTQNIHKNHTINHL